MARWAAVAAVAAGTWLGFARDAKGETVYWRPDPSNGNWWNNPYPWCTTSGGGGTYYTRPDDGDTYRDIHIGNNAQTTMTLNGRWFLVNYLEFESGASTARTLNKSGDTGINIKYGIKNLSTANHVFAAPVSFDASSQSVWAQNGSLTFKEPLYLNQAVTFEPSSGKTISAAGGITANANGTLTKAGAGTMTVGTQSVNNASFRITANSNVGDLTFTQVTATTNVSYAVDVGSGSKVTIGTMQGNGILRKSGAGTLEIGTANTGNTRGLGFWGGTLVPRSGGTFRTVNFTNFADGAYASTGNANILHLDSTTLFNRIVFTNTSAGKVGKFIIESKVTSASACATLQATNVWNLKDKVVVKFIPAYTFNSAVSATWDIMQTVRPAGEFNTNEMAQISIDGSELGIAGTNCFALSLVNTTLGTDTRKRIIRVTYTPPVVKPTMTDGGASGISSTGATVSGSGLNAGGASTTVTFGYGTASGSYTNSATVTGSPFAAGTTSGAPSVSLTGLEPGTKYYYQWTLTNSKGAQTYTGSFTTSATAPTVTTGSATGITTNQATLSATVTANGGAALTANGAGVKWGTSSGTYTTGSATYSGTPTVNTPFQVTATGLTPGTQYYYVGYAANSVGTGTTPTASEGSFYTKCSTPTAPTGLSIARTSQVKLTPSWTAGAKGTGGGTLGYVVLVNASDETPPSLTDGTVYSAGDDLGDGWSVVGTTTSTSLPASGLTKDTVYYFAVYSYAGVDGQASTYAYSTSATALTGSQFTENSIPSNWTATFTTNAQGTSATISWSAYAGANSFDGYVLLLRAGTTGAETPPTNDPQPSSPSAQKEGEDDFWEVGDTSGTGTTVVYLGTETSTTVSGLSPLTGYKVRVLAYDGDHYRTYKSGGVMSFVTTEKTGPDLWATGVDGTSFLLNWSNSVVAANGYNVQVKERAGTFSPQTDVLDDSFTTAEGWTAGDPGASYTANSGTWKFSTCTVQPTGTGMGDTGYVYVSGEGSTVETPLMHDAVSHVEVQWRNGAGGRKVRVDVDRNGNGDYSDSGEQGVCVWTNLTTSGCQTNFLYFAQPRTSMSGIRIRFYNLGLVSGYGSGNTIYIHRVKVGTHRGHSQLLADLTSGSWYDARVRNAPNGDWSDTLAVKAGVVPTGLATGAVTRSSAAFTWSGANSPSGYRWQATTNAATGWTNLCTDGDTLTGENARSLYTNQFKTGRQWMYIGTDAKEHAGGGSVDDTPRYITRQTTNAAHYLSGKAGLGIQSTNFPVAGATNIVLSYKIINWNLKLTGATHEMGRVDAYYKLDEGPWCYLGTGLPPDATDGYTFAQSFTLDKGYLDGTNISFKVVAPNAGHGTYNGNDRLVGPGIKELQVVAQGGLGDYTTLFAEGTDSGSATVTGLDASCPVYFRVQALQGANVRSVWVETNSASTSFAGPTPEVEGTGRYEVTATWPAYDGDTTGYTVSYNVQLTGCAQAGNGTVSECPASGREFGSDTDEWTYQQAYTGSKALSWPAFNNPWHDLVGTYQSMSVRPGLESPEMDLSTYEKATLQFSHNYYNASNLSQVAVYYKVGDGAWTWFWEAPRAGTYAQGSAAARSVRLPDAAIGETRVKVKLVATNAHAYIHSYDYDGSGNIVKTNWWGGGARVFNVKVVGEGAGGGDYECAYTTETYNTNGTSFTFNAETLAGDSHLTGLTAGSNYYVHVQTVLTPAAGAATTSDWGEDGMGTTAAPQLPPAEVWAEDVKQQHLTVGWAEADGADEDTLYWVQLAASSCTPTKWSSVAVPPSATNADLTVDDDWFYIGGGTEVDAVEGVKGTETNWITGRGVYPAWASIKQGATKGEWSQVLAGEGAPGIESASFSTVGATNAILSFGHGRWFAHRQDAGPATVLSLYYSTDGGGSWSAWANTSTTAVEYAYDNITNFTLPSAALGKSAVKVRIVAEAGDIGYSTNNATIKHARGAAVTAAKVTLNGARGDYENCLMRDVAGLTYDQLSQVFGDLTNSTLYYFRVAASDGTQYGAWVDGSATTLAAPGTPGAPWQVSAGRKSLTMTWAPVEGAETYTLALLTGNGGGVSQSVTGIEGTTYTWTGLNANSTYYFKVSAQADGASSDLGPQGSGRTAAALTAPEVTATNITLGSIRFQWPVDNEATYTVKAGPTTAEGTGADEILAAPMSTLKRSDAGNGWFYIGGNADYPKYFASGTDTNDCGHVLAYTAAGSPGLQSRWFSTRGAKSATVEFLHGRYGNSGKNSAVDVYYSTDYGYTWTLAGSAAATNASKPTVERVVALPAAALDKRAVAVRLVAPDAVSGNAYGAELKNLKVRVAAGAQDSWTAQGTSTAGGMMYVDVAGSEGTRYGISVVAASTTDSSVAGTTNSAATRMRRTGVSWSQGFDGSAWAYGAFDPAGKALTFTAGYWTLAGANAGSYAAGTERPVVEVVEGVNPMYGDKALRMSGSKNASAFGVADFTGVNFSDAARESVTVTIPFAAQDLGANDYLYVAWATNNAAGTGTWTWHAPGATNQTSMGSIPLARIGVGGGDVMNRNWPYNRGTNATTRPKGDAYSFRIDDLAGQLKIRVAFCGQSGGAARYYWIDEVGVSRNPGMVTGQSATAQPDGSVNLAWTGPSDQYTIIIRGQDMRTAPSSVDLANLPDGYELVKNGSGTYAFADSVSSLNDATADSGWRYYYYFYGAIRNDDGSYTLGEPVSAWTMVKGTVHAIASMGWDGWDAHPWAYRKGRVTNPGRSSDYGFWKSKGMNATNVAFIEGSWETDARNSVHASGQYYTNLYGKAGDAESTNQLGVTSTRAYYGYNSYRLSGGGSWTWDGTHVWTDYNGNVKTNSDVDINTNNVALEFANVDLSGYKNVEFQMHYAGTNLNGGNDLHVAINLEGGAPGRWMEIGNDNEARWRLVGTNYDYGRAISDGDTSSGGNWDWYFEDAKRTPYGNPYVLEVPDSVTQFMVRVMFYDSNGGSKRKASYFIDEIRLLGEVAMETPKPIITDNAKTSFTVCWSNVPDAEGYNVKITAVPSNGVVKLAEPFAQSVTPDGWTNSTSGVQYPTTASRSQAADDHGLKLSGDKGMAVTPEVGAATNVTFWVKASATGTNTMSVRVKPMGSDSWETLQTYTAATVGTSWRQYSVALPYRQWQQVAFVRTGSGADFSIDDMEIHGGGDYRSVTTSVGADGARLYNSVTVTNQAFTGLTAGTRYYAEVQAYGSPNGVFTTSGWGETADYTSGDFTIREDGFEMTRSTWAAPGSGSAILVMAVPEGQAYTNVVAPTNTAVGGINGTGVVLTNSTAAVSGAGFEHVRPYGSRTEDYEAKYVVYWKHGNYWEGRLETNVVLGTYVAQVAEAFAYTNGTAMTAKGSQAAFNTGKGWASAWEVTEVPWSGAWAGQEVQNGSQPYGLVATNKLWGAGGNMLALYPTNNNTTASVKRVLSAPLSKNAEWWGMFTMKVTYSGGNKWAGMQLLNSSGQNKASIGKLWNGSGIGVEGSATYTSGQTIGDGGTKTIVFYWDKSTMWLKTFAGGSTFRPTDSAPAFDGSVALSMDDIHAIQLVAQNGSGVLYPVWFDEIRLGATWEDLVGKQTEPPLPVKTPQAWADGNELVRIAWQYDGGRTNAGVINPLATGVRIYAKEGVGEGEWVEIYKGSGTNATPAKDAWSRWDHVVLPGSTHQYRVEAYAGGKYTNAVDAVNRDAAPSTEVSTGLYGEKEFVNPFSYTNNVGWTTATWYGGNGFSNNWWHVPDGAWTNVNPETAQAALHITNAVPGSRLPAGNVLMASVTNGATASINRTLGGNPWCGTAGETFYVAFRMGYQWSGRGKEAGLRLTDAGGSHIQIGKGYANEDTESGRKYWSVFGVTATPFAGGSESTGWMETSPGNPVQGSMSPFGGAGQATNAYLVVAKVYWLTKDGANSGKVSVKAWKYQIGVDSLPGEEPSGNGDAQYDNARLGAISKIELIAGCRGDSANTIGSAYFDEIRFGTSWEDIVGATEPEDVWTAGITNGAYKGDFATWTITSKPHGPKQSAWVVISSNDTAFANSSVESNSTTWVDKVYDTDHWNSVWQGHELQFKGAGTWYGGGVVKGELVTVKSWERSWPEYKWNTYNVTNLPNPTKTNDVNSPPEVFTGDAKLGLAWAPATVGGRTFPEVMIVRFPNGADAWSPTDGNVYLKGGSAGGGTVVYRGTNSTSLVDKGLNTNSTYRYQFYTVNNSYYSPGVSVTGTTSTNAPPIEINGDPNDWIGEPSEVKNSSKLSPNGEWIWTDKVGDGRKDNNGAYDADITEFRIKVDATNVYFMARLNCLTNPANPYIAVGIATNVDATRLAPAGNEDGENWLGDEANTFMGGNLFSPASLHYADIQMTVHQVGGTWQIELFKKGGSSWYGPGGVGDVTWQVASSEAGAEDPCVEWKLKRSDLGLDFGSVTPARFTVASFVNSGGWNNDVVGTTKLSDGTSYAVDTLAIAPWGVNDKDLSLTAWDEGIKNNNAEYWFDIWFGPGALHNAAPTDAALSYPPNNATNIPASPTMTWTASTDGPSDESSYRGFVVGYLVEVSTNEYFNGLEGTMENGPISCRVNIPGATNTSYRYLTDSRYYWWRVRARDNSGALSSPTVWHYAVEGKTDNEGPEPRLLYVGTNVMMFVTNEAYRTEQTISGDATSVLDSELEDGGHTFGFVIEWYDVNGVYATNHMHDQLSSPTPGGFAFNILAEHSDGVPYGRVSPNWDLVIVDRALTNGAVTPDPERVGTNTYSWTFATNGLVLPTDDGGTETVTNWYIDCGLDKVFNNAETKNDGNFGQYLTNFVTGAFSIGNYRTSLDIYLTVSAEDGCETGETGPSQWITPPVYSTNGSAGSYAPGPQPGANGSTLSSGWCADFPNPARNVTTNRLLHIHVRDNDTIPPTSSTAKWRTAATNDAGESLLPMVAVATGATTIASASWDPTWTNLDRSGLGRLPTYDGTGKTLQWQLTDGDVANGGNWQTSKKLNFFFNVYDEYLHSGMQTNRVDHAPYEKDLGTFVRTNDLWNTGMILKNPTTGNAETNWTAYAVGISTNGRQGGESHPEHGRGTDPETVLAWTYTATAANVQKLLGVSSPLAASTIGTNAAGEQLVVTNALKLFAWDSDNNAPGDQEGQEIEFGQLIFTDDDATPPTSPGYDLIGTGTNHIDYGNLGSWTWANKKVNKQDTPDPAGWITNSAMDGIEATAMQAYVVRSSLAGDSLITTNVSWVESTSRDLGETDSTHYMQVAGGMRGATYRTPDNAKYFRFDVRGSHGTRWMADSLQFNSRVTKTGPVKFALTVQEDEGLTALPAMVDGQLNPEWDMAGGSAATVAGLDRITFEDAGGTVSLVSEGFTPKGKVLAQAQFRIGRIGTAKAGTYLTLSYQINSGAWTQLARYTNEAFTASAAESYRNYLVETIDLPTGSDGTFKVKWEATGVNGSQGFVMTDAKIVLQDSFGEERPLVTDLVVEKYHDPYSDDVTNSLKSVMMTWTPEENASGATWRYRLYAYGANGTGNWGINGVKLGGVTMAPKGVEVTDGDMRHHTWENSLVVLEGDESGYDTAKSGLWMTDDGGAYTQYVPQYTLSYPEADTAHSGVFSSGEFTLGDSRQAAYTPVPDSDFSAADPADNWILTAAAVKDISGTRGRAAVLESLDETVSSVASKPFAVNLGTISEDEVAGLTLTGNIELKASVAGGANAVVATVELMDEDENVLFTRTWETNTVAAWRKWAIGPWHVDNNLVRNATVSIAQTTAAGDEIAVSDVAILLATWGPGGQTATNGIQGVKFSLTTEDVEAGKALPLSSELNPANGSTDYQLVSKVYDYDHDRDGDALPVTATKGFALYDDDEEVPRAGKRFGGPLGMRIGSGPTSLHNGSDSSVVSHITDKEMEQAQAAAGAGTVWTFLDLDWYDLSGWETIGLSLKYGDSAARNLYTKGDASPLFQPVVTNGEANLPSATNTFKYGLASWWNDTDVQTEFGKTNGTDLVKMAVTAIVTDQDNDRLNDALAVTSRVGYIEFLDSDYSNPNFKNAGTMLYQVFIATNPPGGSISAAYTGVSTKTNTGWAAKSQYEVRTTTSNDTASARVQAIYDSELTNGDFFVMANLGDANATADGQDTAGIQQGAKVSQGKTNAFNNSYTVYNTTIVFSNTTANAGYRIGDIVVNMASNWSSTYSSAQKTTRGLMGAAPQTWAWEGGMTRLQVGDLLPATATNLEYRLIVEAWDADTDRADDQMHRQLLGPTLQVRDDDTVPPSAPEDPVLYKGGEELAGDPSAEDDRYRVPWVNELSGLSVQFTAAVDGDGTEGGAQAHSVGGYYDKTVSDIGHYEWALPGDETPVPGLGTTLTAEDAGDRKSASLSVDMDQGYGDYRLFAVDADDDRPGDALAGAAETVPLGYDATPPPAIGYSNVVSSVTEFHRLTADPDSTDDPTTQFDLVWPTKANGAVGQTQLGPDDTKHARHPTHLNKDYDYLSPWATYKIYYTNYDETAIASDDNPNSETKSWVYTNYVKTEVYKAWQSVTATNRTTDPSTNATPYLSLTNVTANGGTDQQKIRLFDLDFDQHYVVVIVGVDRAGNEGPAGLYSWATNNTIKFAITQGVARASSAINVAVGIASGTNSVGMAPIPSGGPSKAATLYWMAAGMKDGAGEVKKYYDLIYRDAPSFNELGNETWLMAGEEGGNSGTSKTNWNYHADEGLGTPGRLRFYRASYTGRWQDTKPGGGQQTPLASEEVYSMHNVVVTEGKNYVSLQGVPWERTFRGVFGTDTNMWPAGITLSDPNATKIEFYESGESEVDVESYCFYTATDGTADGTWMDATNRVVTDLRPGPLTDGKRTWFELREGRWYKDGDTTGYWCDERTGVWKHGETALEGAPFDETFFARPFGIVLPSSDDGAPEWWAVHDERLNSKYGSHSVSSMVWHAIMQVPTNGPVAGVYSNTINGTAGYYNLLSLNLPVAVHPRDLRLVATNSDGNFENERMYVSENPWEADKLYVPDTSYESGVRKNSMIYCASCTTNGQTWKFVTGGTVPDGFILPNDMIVLVPGENDGPESWTWTYTPTNFYNLPTRHMGRDLPRN